MTLFTGKTSALGFGQLHEHYTCGHCAHYTIGYVLGGESEDVTPSIALYLTVNPPPLRRQTAPVVYVYILQEKPAHAMKPLRVIVQNLKASRTKSVPYP